MSKRLSLEEFERIVLLPENSEKRLEYIGGEIVEAISTFSNSVIGASISAAIGNHVEENHLGFVTGAKGGYEVSGERYLPIVAFLSRARHPKHPRYIWVPLAPDLVVEVLSPMDGISKMVDKVANYLSAGTLVWYVLPEREQIKIYEPGQPVKTLRIGDMLGGGKVLPGFQLLLKDIFPTEE